jgi:hypothetical protein
MKSSENGMAWRRGMQRKRGMANEMAKWLKIIISVSKASWRRESNVAKYQ